MDYRNRSWAIVDLDALENNYHVLRKTISDKTMFLAIVKANAYGHGGIKVSRVLQELGVNYFGVATIQEAIELRENGIITPILVLGYTPVEFVSDIAKYDITQTVFSKIYADKLSKEASRNNVKINVQVKVDTGMNRIGYKYTDITDMAGVYNDDNFECSGIFTHFAIADELSFTAKENTKTQFERFMYAIDSLNKLGIDTKIRHCCNSAGTLLYPNMHLDMVRLGIVMYGIEPSEQLKEYTKDLIPVMSLHSRISMLKEVNKDEGISYGLHDKADKNRMIATIPIGYADGYLRSLSSNGKAIVNGVKVNVVGRVCMDQLMLDVTNVQVKEGDIVTFVGKVNEKIITFADMAKLAGTIAYELVCTLGDRINRIYKRNSEIES